MSNRKCTSSTTNRRLVILNDVYPTTIEDNKIITVKGTFLILFENTVKINNSIFINHKKLFTKLEAHPPKLVTLTSLQHENKISLPYLHKLNTENTNLIQNINEDLETHTVLWWLTLALIVKLSVILLLVFLVKRACKNNKRGKKVSNIMSMEELKSTIDSINTRLEDESA